MGVTLAALDHPVKASWKHSKTIFSTKKSLQCSFCTSFYVKIRPNSDKHAVIAACTLAIISNCVPDHIFPWLHFKAVHLNAAHILVWCTYFCISSVIPDGAVLFCSHWEWWRFLNHLFFFFYNYFLTQMKRWQFITQKPNAQNVNAWLNALLWLGACQLDNTLPPLHHHVSVWGVHHSTVNCRTFWVYE